MRNGKPRSRRLPAHILLVHEDRDSVSARDVNNKREHIMLFQDIIMCADDVRSSSLLLTL